MLLFTCTELFLGCCTGDRQTLENMPALWKHSRRLMKAASAWFSHPTLGIYIPVPARGKNKLLHTVTDATGHATGHTTGRSLQAIYQKKRVFKFHSESLDEKTGVIKRKAIDKLESIRPSFEKSLWKWRWERVTQQVAGITCSPVLALWWFKQSGITVLHAEVPATCTQDCDCNGPHISGGPGLSLRPPASRERDAFGTWMHGISWSQRKISTSGIQHPPSHRSTSQRKNHGRKMDLLMHSSV